MALGNPRKISGKRPLLVAKLVGVSGQFQRTKYSGSTAFNLQTGVEVAAAKRTKGAAHFVMSFFSSAYAQPLSNGGASTFATQFGMTARAVARYLSGAISTSAQALMAHARVVAKGASIANSSFTCEALAKSVLKGATVSVLAFGMSAAGAVPPPPFTADSDTYWWDFDHSRNTLDDNGHSTLSIARERLRGEVNPWQPTKARQPLKVTGGINFNQATNRSLIIDLPTLTNGKNGWYLAGVIQPTTSNIQIMSIARAAGTQMSRMDMLLTSSRNLGFRGVGGDGASPAFVIYTAPLTLGQVYAFEFLWDFDTDTATVWLGGVQQTPALGPTGGPWSNFPATNPSAITIGNTVASPVTSFNGTIRQLIFKDGVPDAGQRSSISAYNLSRAA